MKTKSWSCALEHGDYATNKDLVITDSVEAVAQTAVGYHVNLVTPKEFGNPDTYLTPRLKDMFTEHIRLKFIDQCGCGGYVLRVWKVAP